jgi:hypothetical protein
MDVMTDQHRELIKSVCKHFNLKEELLYTNTRKKTVILGKHVCMYILKTRYGLSYKEIADLFPIDGKAMDHTSAIHAKRSIESALSVGYDYIKIPYDNVISDITKKSNKKFKEPNKLIISFNPHFPVENLIKTLKRHYVTLEYEIR